MTEAQAVAIEYAKQHRNYERRIKPLFLNALRKNAEPALKWIESYGAENVPLDILVNPNDFIAPMINAYMIVAPLAAQREYFYQKRTKASILDILSGVWAGIFRVYSTTYAYRIQNNLSETTKELIREAIQEGYDLNLNANQLASYIRKKVSNEISRDRAVTIARTEATTASNLGKFQGAKSYFEDQGMKGYKQWIGRNDGRERHSHIMLNDDIIPMDEEWQVGNEQAERPGDLVLSGKERINCRCTQMFISERRYLRLQQEK